MSRLIRATLAFVFILVCVAASLSQERSSDSNESAVNGSLSELRDKRTVWLIVRRSGVLDARGTRESVLTEIYRNANEPQTFPRTYNMIAKRLNKYMKERGSISAAPSLREADFILFFNVLEIRRPLGTPYVYGELFIVLNQPSNPRILWKTRSKGAFVDDAMNDFISALKAARGEK